MLKPVSEELKPTDEQIQLLDRLRQTDDNIFGNALAGSGKTASIKMMVEVNAKKHPQLYLAFNKANVKEAEEKMPSSCKVQTFNSLGHRSWGDATGKKLVIDQKMPKMPTILKQLISELRGDDKEEAWDHYGEILKAVSMAKHLGYIPEGKFPHARPLTDRQGLENRLEDRFTPFCWSLIDAALFTSIKAAYDGGIDY